MRGSLHNSVYLHAECPWFAHPPLQTELTLRLGLQLPFPVSYDGVQALFHHGRLFEQPGANVTVVETRSAHECGSGPFFR